MATKDDVSKGPKFLDKKRSGTQCAFVFGDGGKLYFDPAKVNDETRVQAMYHGFFQKIGDAASGFSKEKDFEGARVEMGKVIDSLYGNSWNRTGGGAGSGIVMGDLARAIATIREVGVEKATLAVEKASPEQRTAWAKNGKVAELMARYKAERLTEASKMATDEGLPTFEEEEEPRAGDEE